MGFFFLSNLKLSVFVRAGYERPDQDTEFDSDLRETASYTDMEEELEALNHHLKR